jgi:hypothetical protein
MKAKGGKLEARKEVGVKLSNTRNNLEMAPGDRSPLPWRSEGGRMKKCGD